MHEHFNWIFAYFLKAAVCILLAHNGMFNMLVWWLAAGSAPARAPRILVFLVSHVVGLFLLRTATTRRRRTRKVAGCSSISDGACHVLALEKQSFVYTHEVCELPHFYYLTLAALRCSPRRRQSTRFRNSSYFSNRIRMHQ